MACHFFHIAKRENQFFYKGFTENPSQRLIQHIVELIMTVRKKMPWKMVFLIEYDTKKKR